MITTSILVSEINPKEITDLLVKASSLLFGVRSENQHEDLFTSSYGAICERFKGVTILDIRNAYNYAVIEKKAYTTLTRDELIQPITDYFKKKKLVVAEIEALKREEDKKKNEILEVQNFKFEVKQIYLESLEVGKWLGSEIQAYSLRNNFAHLILQEEKNKMYKEAQIEHRQREANQGQFELVPSDVYIYARMFIEQMIDRRIKFIEV